MSIKIRSLAYLIFASSFLVPVHAAEFESYNLVAELEDFDIVKCSFFITIYNDEERVLKTASISIPPDSEIVSVSDSYGELGYTASIDRSLKLHFNFTVPVEPGNERLIIVQSKTKSLIKQKDDFYEYLLIFTPKQEIKNFEHVLRLPEDVVLHSPQKMFSPVVVPRAEINYLEDKIVILWNVRLGANEPEVFLVRFKSPREDYLWLVAIVVLALCAGSAFGISARKVWKKYKKLKTIISLKILNERERMVVEEIVRNEGIEQYDLREKLGYTKSSLSKILSKLESRGIIRREKTGKINRWFPGKILEK